MRNTLILLSSLALAAAASAQTSAVYASSSTTSGGTVDYSAPASVTARVLGTYLDSYGGTHDSKPYIFNSTTDPGGVSFGDDGYENYTGPMAANGAFASASFVFDTSAKATLESTASQYPDISGFADHDVFFGYRSYVEVTNNGASSQQVSFASTCSQGAVVSAGSVIGVAQTDGAGDFLTPGAYGGSFQDFGVIDVTDEQDVGRKGESFYSFQTDPEVTGIRSSLQSSFAYTPTLAAGETRVFEVYASSEAEVSFLPVPEPSAFAALGLGALGLLRRRRR